MRNCFCLCLGDLKIRNEVITNRLDKHLVLVRPILYTEPVNPLLPIQYTPPMCILCVTTSSTFVVSSTSVPFFPFKGRGSGNRKRGGLSYKRKGNNTIRKGYFREDRFNSKQN